MARNAAIADSGNGESGLQIKHPGFWQDMVEKHGSDVAEFLPLAGKIENWCKLIGTKLPTSMRQLKRAAACAVYERGAEKPDFAVMAMENNLPEHRFNTALDLLATRRHRGHNYLPTIAIDGDEIGRDGFVFERLSPKEARKVVVRHLLGGGYVSASEANTDEMLVHGLTSRRGGFYALRRKDDMFDHDQDRPMAVIWTWVGDKREVVFDTVMWNNDAVSSKEEAHHILTPFLRQFVFDMRRQTAQNVARAIKRGADAADAPAELLQFGVTTRVQVRLGHQMYLDDHKLPEARVIVKPSDKMHSAVKQQYRVGSRNLRRTKRSKKTSAPKPS